MIAETGGGATLASDLAPIRVLVAEDDPLMRSALEALLASEPDFAIAGVVEDAEAAIGLARAERPDAAILDVRMPGGGGPFAARRIREVSPSTRIVALSAYTDRATVLDMLRAGAQEYVLKGTEPDLILEALRRAGRGRVVLGETDVQELLGAALDLLEAAEGRVEATRDRLRAMVHAAAQSARQLEATLAVLERAGQAPGLDDSLALRLRESAAGVRRSRGALDAVLLEPDTDGRR